MHGAAQFFELFCKEPVDTLFCPYRICPIGAHSDHQYGKITGLAIDRGIHLIYAPDPGGRLELASRDFPGLWSWQLDGVPERPLGDWADHLRGATFMLSRQYELTNGLCGLIRGGLPIGGLSSSASVILVFLWALCKVNGIRPGKRQLIRIALQAERDYLGVSVGTLDQSCEVLSTKDHLLYLDTLRDEYESIPAPNTMKPYRIAILFSGLQRSLVHSPYNSRVEEARAAARILAGYEGIPLRENALRFVPRSAYERHKLRLPENLRRRAEHFYSEFERVEQGAEAWRRGDMDSFGRLCFASGASSIHNWETGSPELTTLYEILKRTDGVYGARFSGAGFKGCCMALIDPAFAGYIEEAVSGAYLVAFPGLKERYAFYLCSSSDGIGRYL